MVYRVVSTKLSEEEHTKLLDECNKKGCSPSALLREMIMNSVQAEPAKDPKDLSNSELAKLLGLMNKE